MLYMKGCVVLAMITIGTGRIGEGLILSCYLDMSRTIEGKNYKLAGRLIYR